MDIQDFQILFATSAIVPIVFLVWMAAAIFRKPSLFQWAGILQCAIGMACIFYFLFGVIPHNPNAGMAAGLSFGLITAAAGRIFLKMCYRPSPHQKE